MNLTALTGALRTRLGVPSTDALFTDSVCTELINAAVHAIEVKHDWPWLEAVETINTVNGTDTYTPASGWMRTVSVTISGRPPLERRTIEEIDLLLGASGDPRFYTVFAEQIVVRPVPTSALAMKHRYIKTETDLSAGSDTPLIPAAYHQAVVSLAAHYGFRRSNQLADAGAALAEYQQWEDRMLTRGDRLSEENGGGEAPVTVPAVVAKR